MAVPHSDIRKARNYLWIIGIVGALTGLAIVLLSWRSHNLVNESHDPYGYEAMGRNFLHGHNFEGFGSVLNRRGPLYPIFIALIYRIFGESVPILQLTQCLLLGGTCMLVFDIGRRMFNLRTGLIAGIICALHPSFLRYIPDFHVEIFLTFFTTLMIWSSVRFRERPGPATGFAFGVAVALTALTKAVVVLYPVVFLGYWLLFDLRKTPRIRPEAPDSVPVLSPATSNPWPAIVAVFVAMGCVILPWTARNYQSSGKIVLITTGLGDAYLRGLIFSKTEYITLRQPPYTGAEHESNNYFRKLCADQGTVWERNDIESDRILGQEMKRRLVKDPVLLVRKFVIGLFTFWYEMTSLTNSLIAGCLALISGILAFIGWRKVRGTGQEVWPLVLPILYLNVLLALLLALGRYSVPMLPSLTILAALGIDSMLPKSTDKG